MAAQKQSQTKLDTSSNIGRDKSFVDDLNKELGIVRMRVAFVPRSAEIQPTFWRFVTITLSFSFLFFQMRKKLNTFSHWERKNKMKGIRTQIFIHPPIFNLMQWTHPSFFHFNLSFSRLTQAGAKEREVGGSDMTLAKPGLPCFCPSPYSQRKM